MKPFGIGLAAALIVAVLAPAAVLSASKGAAPAVSEAQRKQGMAEAPAIAQAAGIACQVTDARFIGKQADPKTKASTSYYEIDCDKGLGFILQAPSGGKPGAFTCVEADTPQPDGKPSSLPCVLPGNADPKADLVPLLAKAGVTGCTPDGARGIGQSSTNTFMEVSCQGGSGYVIQAASPATLEGAVVANDCLVYDAGEGNIKCTLHDKASRMAVVDQYVKAANNGCVVKDKRFVGMAQSGSAYWEASCQDGKGYIYQVEKGQLAKTFECAKAQGILGGCELTDSKQAETEQAGLYTKLAKAAGFDCAVTKYGPFPSPAGKDVVELSCSNRPDGAVGIFAGPGQKSSVVDCARAPLVGYRCSFSKPTFDSVTADLKKMGKDSCTVSAIRIIGKTAKGTTYLETACSDGLKGYVLEYTTEPLAPVSATGCAFTKDCKLPGNV